MGWPAAAASSSASARALAAAIGARRCSIASTASVDAAVAVSTTHEAWWGWPSRRARSARSVDDLQEGRSGVVLAAEAAGDGRGVQSFPQVAVGEGGEGGLFGGQDEGEEVAVEAAGAGRARRRRERVGGEAVELAGSVTCTAAAAAPASSRLPNSVVSDDSSALIARSRSCSAAASRAPARTASRW